MNCIGTSHELARELINRESEFITATIGDKEYVIDNIRRIKTHANIDDSVTHLTLNLRNFNSGNIIR